MIDFKLKYLKKFYLDDNSYKIQTPLLQPNRDYISIVLIKQDNEFTLTDFGLVSEFLFLKDLDANFLKSNMPLMLSLSDGSSEVTFTSNTMDEETILQFAQQISWWLYIIALK